MNEIKNPDKVKSYFFHEWPVLLIVTVSGIFYNTGMVAGPYFEGQLAQCLYEIIKGTASKQKMYSLVLIYLAVILFVQIMRALKRFFVRIFASNVSRSMRHNLYNSLISMKETELKQQDLGSIMTKAIADVDSCAEGMRKFTTEVFDTGVVMIVYMGMLLWYDWRLTLLSCMFTPLAYFIANRLKKTVSSANSAYKKSASGLNLKTMDRISGAITYRIFGRELSRNQDYEQCLTDYEHKSARANVLESSLYPVYDAISMIGVIPLLYFGSRNVTGTGWTVWNIASFTTFLACFTKLAVKASKAAKLFNSVQKARVSWKRIKPLMKQAENHIELDYTEKAEPVKLSVKIEQAGYEAFSLNQIAFEAEPGQIIGVTGVVASGKSMLGKIFIGDTPHTGAIEFTTADSAPHTSSDSTGTSTDSTAVSSTVAAGVEAFANISEERRCQLVSYMGHETELLSTTVKENVAMGDKVDVWKYLKIVCLDEEVKALPEQEETQIGNGGMMLSGGQQARLALARTLAHAKSVIILDDPFSAVDKATETAILNNIKEMCKDRIVLLISHRLYHFPEFSRVIFLQNNKAILSNHLELMETNAEYKQLYENQMKGGDLDEE